MDRNKQSRRRDGAEKRAEILSEAIRIIGERGYYGFAVQDLATRCGLTTAGLLYHFRTKEDLFLAVLAERDERAEAALMQLVGAIPSESLQRDQVPLEVAAKLLRAMMQITVSQPELSRLFIVLSAEALCKQHPGHAYFRQREERVIGMLAHLVRKHVIDPITTARQISALMFGLQQQWLGSDGSWDLLEQWDDALTTVLPGAGAGADRVF